MNKEQFKDLVRKEAETYRIIEDGIEYWDGFLMDYPEEIDGVNTADIVEEVMATQRVEISWGDE